VIRREHAYSQDGGLAVLFGNIAEDGCIVKTAGVDESILKFSGPARIFESQDERCLRDPDRQGQAGRCGADPLRGAARRTRHAGNALSDQLPEIQGTGQGLRAGHRRPLLGRLLGPVHRPRLAEAAEGGTIGLVEEGDTIVIDIPNRVLKVDLPDASWPKRRAAMEARKVTEAWKPVEKRKRKVTTALKAYAAMTSSAAKGAVRIV
jgi:dihydroxy-acid dehydratase